MRIVVLGYIVRGPLGGLCFHYLQYLLGFKKMGHEVLFMEDSDNYPSCYNPETFMTTVDPGYGLKFIENLFHDYGLENSWAYYDEHSSTWYGMDKKKVNEFCASAEYIFNISNVNPLREWWTKIPNRVLIDTDPGFTQIRHIEEERYRKIAEIHTHFFSFGENIGTENCFIPGDGFIWKPTRQPIVLSLWPVSKADPNDPWTTVMQWDSYKTRTFNGMDFGMKSLSFENYFRLPGLSTEKFELAVGSTTAPKEKLLDHGWQIRNPLEVTKTSKTFQQYIKHSKGEFSIAKQGYVISQSGWFSERSANYLASGRPVVVQDSGLKDLIETGNGLHLFNSLEEAIMSIGNVTLDYEVQCVGARKLAEDYFDSDMVLGKLIREI